METKKEQRFSKDDTSTEVKTEYSRIKDEPVSDVTMDTYLRQPGVKNASLYNAVKSKKADSNNATNTFISDMDGHRSARTMDNYNNSSRDHFASESVFEKLQNIVTDRVELEIDVDISNASIHNVTDSSVCTEFGIRESYVSLNHVRWPEHQHREIPGVLPSLHQPSRSQKRLYKVINARQNNCGSSAFPLDNASTLKMGTDKIILHDKAKIDESLGRSSGTEFGNKPTVTSVIVEEHGKHLEDDFKCPVCLTQFQSIKSMQNHKAKIHGNNIYHCDTCDKWFPTPYTFNEHSRIHSGILPYKCTQCGKSFRTFRYLSRHARKHDDSRKIHVCEFCGKRFFHPSKLQTHISMHTDNRRYKCKDCGKAYRYDGQLRIHRRHHTGERFYCDICEKPFVDKADLKRHYSRHSDARPFVCDICGTGFKRKQYLKTHAFVHLDTSSVDAKTCDVCGMTFKLQCGLTKHMEIHAQNRPSFPCDLCGSVFSTKWTLRHHSLNTCSARQYPEWECQVCGKHYKTKGNLHKHSKRHTDGYKYPCKLCNKSFCYNHHLQIHIRKSHLKERKGTKCEFCKKIFANIEQHMEQCKQHKPRYTCLTCGKQFKLRNNFRTHQNIHLRRKPYKCDFCQHTFAQKGMLKIHIFRKYLAKPKHVKPLVTEQGTLCKLCGLYRRDIKAHMEYHKSVGKVQCSLCKKSFNTIWHLNSHSKIHLDLKPWKCDTCQKRFTEKCDLTYHIIRRHMPKDKTGVPQDRKVCLKAEKCV